MKRTAARMRSDGRFHSGAGALTHFTVRLGKIKRIVVMSAPSIRPPSSFCGPEAPRSQRS
jgi:hypothetical protein